ncbi:hypothetical protein [Nostoc sp.]
MEPAMRWLIHAGLDLHTYGLLEAGDLNPPKFVNTSVMERSHRGHG